MASRHSYAGPEAMAPTPDHYRALNILDHLGKGVSKFMIRPFIGQATAQTEPTQVGATAKRATRDAIAMTDDIFRRCRVGARHSKS
eukprot:1957387-Pyramimonas_sp.AAC.1